MAARVRVNFRRPCSWCPRQRWQIAAVNANNSHHSFQVFFNKSDKPFNATASCWDQLTSRMSLPSNKSRLWDDPSTFNDVFNNYWFGVSILTEVKKCENGGIGTTITIRQFDSKENVIKKEIIHFPLIKCEFTSKSECKSLLNFQFKPFNRKYMVMPVLVEVKPPTFIRWISCLILMNNA